MEPLTLVIPTFNEAETIGGVIREIPVAYRLDIIVADVGSTDGTQAVAQAAGARVIDAGRGYGRACALGATAAHPKSTAIAFMDGNGADRGDLTGEIAQSVLDGTYDLVLASRTRGEREPGAMLWHQVFAGRVTRFGIRQPYRDDLLSVMRVQPSLRDDLSRQRIELLRRTQFACRPQLILTDHVHEFDTARAAAADPNDLKHNK
jgi:glycosyltransferase involved in cell wall biosynthesis